MILTILFYVLSFVFSTIAQISNYLTQGWSLWPADTLDGITYFFSNLMAFDYLFNIKALISVLVFVITFDIFYISIRLLMKLFNYIRGTGELNI